MSRLATTILLLVLILTSTLLTLGTLTTGHEWGGDFSAYIMQAQALISLTPHDFIDANRFMLENSSRPIGPVAYPWGFPLLLTPFITSFGLDIFSLKFACVSAFILFLVLLGVGFRSYHKGYWLPVFVGLFALNPTMIRFLNQVLSDIPFLLLSTCCVLLIVRIEVEEEEIVSRSTDRFLLGAAIAATFFIRTNGILLIATLGAVHLIRFFRQRSFHREATVPYLAFLVIVVAWRFLVPAGGGSHIDLMSTVSVDSIMKNLTYYLTLPEQFLVGVPYHALLTLISLPVAFLGMCVYGRNRSPMIIYSGLTLLLYLVWPGHQGLRFLFPILPFYCSFTIAGLEVIAGHETLTVGRLRQAVCLVPLLIILICLGSHALERAKVNQILDRTVHQGPFTTDADKLFSYIKEETRADDIVIFFKPRVMRLMTERRSLMINRSDQLDQGDYLCLHRTAHQDQLNEEALATLIESGRALPAYENQRFLLFRLRHHE